MGDHPTQPGNMWCTVHNKKFSYSWARMDPMNAALRDIHQTGGSLLNLHHARTQPMVIAAPAAPADPWLRGGGSWFDTAKKIGSTVLNGIKSAHQSGLIHKGVELASNIISNRKRSPADPPAVTVQSQRDQPLPTDANPAGPKRRFIGGASF